MFHETCSLPSLSLSVALSLCLSVGGSVLRRQHNLRDLFGAVGAEAGYTSSTEVYEPTWTRARQNAQGEWEVEQAWLSAFTGGNGEA